MLNKTFSLKTSFIGNITNAPFSYVQHNRLPATNDIAHYF